MPFLVLLYTHMAVPQENGMFTFWWWILVIGRYAIMFRFGTRFLALTVYKKANSIIKISY